MLGKLLSKLIPGTSEPESNPEETVEHNGYTIRPIPRQEGASWRTMGEIVKVVDGETLTQSFIRADTHAGRDAAVEHTIAKGKQIIDECGDALFERS